MKDRNRLIINIAAIIAGSIGILLGIVMMRDSPGSSISNAIGDLFGPWFIGGGIVTSLTILAINNWSTPKTSVSSPPLATAQQQTSQKPNFFRTKHGALLVIISPLLCIGVGYGLTMLFESMYQARMLEPGSPLLGIAGMLTSIATVIGIIGIVTVFPMVIAGIAMLIVNSRSK